LSEGYAARTVALARAEAQKRQDAAAAYRARKVASAQAQAEQFSKKVAAYKASPEVFMQRSYLETLSRGSTNSRKYILLTTNTAQTFQLDLQDRIATDLTEIAVPKPK
jgi:regulator of protease activity HflC (stomatin/prohibitin superfamily)